MKDIFKVYEHHLEPARRRFATSAGVTALMSPDVVPEDLLWMLIQFTSRGFRMTEPVEGWIIRAAARCEATGLCNLGRSLRGHAASEAGHHLMMLNDTHALVNRWNALYSPALDAGSLFELEPGSGATRYIAIHEAIVDGDRPFAQVALEYEIEQLPVEFGARILSNCTERLGEDITNSLSFIREHIVLGVGHTAFNRKLLESLLETGPEYLPALVEAGSSILDAYAEFLTDCARAERCQFVGVGPRI